MKSLLTSLSAAALVASTVSVAFAGPTPAPKMAAKPKMAAAAKTMKCPACGMAMPMKKSAATPVAVPIKGKTYYCCADCKAGKEMAAKSAKPTKMAPPAPKK